MYSLIKQLNTNTMRIRFLLISLLLSSVTIYGQNDSLKITSFKFGGFIKTSALNTLYNNGDLSDGNILNNIHMPNEIPIGPSDQNFDNNFIVQESRFNFDVKTKLLDKEVHGFLEFDFLFSGQGNPNISNSYVPRLRHFYFEWDRFTIGQTWSTFMIVVLPDEIDFTGAGEGIVLNRQPQVRYKFKNWWFSVENPTATINKFNESVISRTTDNILPDIVARRNFDGDWGTWSIAGIFRTLSSKDPTRYATVGYGFTTGGKIHVGSRGDDIRMILIAGTGLGRYVGFGFIAGASQYEDGNISTIPSVSGYIAYNHYWTPKKLSSSFSISAFNAYNKSIAVPTVNKTAYSLSGNIKYDILPVLRGGLEYMYASREVNDGTNGSFHRIQLSLKYIFGYHNSVADEKK